MTQCVHNVNCIYEGEESRYKQEKLPKGFKFNSTLDSKYSDHPLFKEKVDRANQILKTVGGPKT